MPEIRQNCRPHLVRVASSQPTTTKITMVSPKTFPTHSRLVSHSRDQSIGSTAPSSLAIQECAHPNRTVPGYGTVLK